MIISSAHDRLVPAQVVRKIADKYGGVVTYREYPDHAHKIILEPGWEKVAGDIDAWLKEALG